VHGASKDLVEQLVGLVRAMGPTIAERAVRYDREASFPFENFADFRAAGLLSMCVPVEHGGFGATFAQYVRVSEEIGHYCGATALTFNMHNATVLWCGQVADLLDMSTEDRGTHDLIRKELFRGIVEDGQIHSQPFSEGIAAGATAGVATRCVRTDGGWLVSGRKIFASLSGAADYYNVICAESSESPIRLLGVPANGEGVSLEGTWDPLGMRGTVSRTLLMSNVFVPDANEWLPVGMYEQAAERYPWLFLSLCPSYLGLSGGIVDVTRAYLRGELGGQATSTRRDHPIKQQGWAQMRLLHEQSRAILYRVVDTAVIDPSEDQLVTAWAASHTVMENAAAIAALAVKVCGGQSMLRHLPLERMYRDARLGSLMLPWSAEVCLEKLGASGLY
jgi:alkylation response protein AidB-like acyl-CoA dehydrogenase